MKSMRNLRYWYSLAVVLAALLAAIAGAPVFAASASVASAAIPSNATPTVGEQIVVTINIDMSGVAAPDNALGSFTGSLDWNPAVLSYHGNSGIVPGFTGVVNTDNVAAGRIVFNGANVAGAPGNIIVLTITLDGVGAGTSALDLEYTAMAAATTFANLVPTLTVTDGEVVVGSAARHYVYLPWVGKIR
jgi:hypothetical protein